MVENRYHLIVNIKAKTFGSALPTVTANDNTIFEVEVYDDAEPFSLSDTYTYHLVTMKKNKTSVIREGTLASGILSFLIGTSETTEEGKVEGTVQIYDADMKRISSAPIAYVVKKDPSLNGSLPADETSLVIANESLFLETIQKTDEQKQRVDDLIAGTPQPSEVVDARGGFTVLRDRLNDVDVHLAQKAAYPILSGEVGVVNILYPYGDVKRYGALGTGTGSSSADDSPFFQNAIDSAYNLKVSVNISSGGYVLKNTLYLPANITIISTGNKISKRGNTDGTVVNTYVNEVFKMKTGVTTVQLLMENLFFYNRSTPYGVLFSGILFSHSNIRYNSFHAYDIVFLSGLNAVTIIENNDIQSITYAFMSMNPNPASTITTTSPTGCTDSYIRNNYINGSPPSNATCFKQVPLSLSGISNNFIEFFMYAFDMGTAGMAQCVFEGNTFDYCFRAFMGVLGSSTISNNKFTHISKSYSGNFVNATTEMKNNDWVAIHNDGNGFNRLSIIGNVVYETDLFIYARGAGGKYNVRVVGNNYHDTSSRTIKRIDFSVDPTSYLTYDQTGIYFDDLMYQNFTTLPKASLTTSPITSFNKQIIFYNNKMLTNISGQWMDSTGVVVTS